MPGKAGGKRAMEGGEGVELDSFPETGYDRRGATGDIANKLDGWNKLINCRNTSFGIYLLLVSTLPRSKDTGDFYPLISGLSFGCDPFLIDGNARAHVPQSDLALAFVSKFRA